MRTEIKIVAFCARLKKIISFVMLVSLLLSFFVYTAKGEEITEDDMLNAICDILGDGQVTAADARHLLRASAQLTELIITDKAKKCGVLTYGDLNGDKLVTAVDARILLRYSSELFDLRPSIKTLIDEKMFKEEEPVNTGKGNLSDAELTKILKKNNLLSPEKNHNLGTANICLIKKDYAETTGISTTEDKSNPNFTAFVKGTMDYIDKAGIVTGKNYLFLNSGSKVLSEDSQIIKGYKMPLNKLQLVAFDNDRTSDIYIKTNWIVPVYLTVKSQKYFTGYDARPWNIENYTAQYIEITFHNTSSVAGTINFEDNSLIKSSKWIMNDNDSATLQLQLRKSGGEYGYTISVTDSGYFKISLKNESNSLKGKTVLLDPGHGGKDPGGGAGGVFEKDIDYFVATEIKTMLEAKGAKVFFTRSGDTFVELEDRVNQIRELNPDIMVSIHCDATRNTSTYGVHTFYYYQHSMPLARSIQNQLAEVYKNTIYKDNEERKLLADKGVKFFPFMVTRVEQCPAVLIEMGFLSNAVEREKLLELSNQKALAKGIATGIENFLN